MSEKVKLVVCNEPQNCGTVKELEARLAELQPDAEKWRFLHLEAEEPLSCQMCRNAHDAVLRKLDSTESRLRAASDECKIQRKKWPVPAVNWALCSVEATLNQSSSTQKREG
jgi:hypothetical protein